MDHQPHYDRSEEVFKFIEAFIREHGYSPSVAEISVGAKLSSTSHTHYWLKKLVDERRITMKERTPRSIVIQRKA